VWFNARVRAAAILGLGSSETDLKPFQESTQAKWVIGLPEGPADADAILIFGGDGTIHRHLGQLVKLQRPVLVVPHGSGNDFARAIGIRGVKDSLTAWQKFCSANPHTTAIDLGIITPAGRYFCCVANLGLDADVARRANKLPRWLRSHGGYVASLPSALFRFAAVHAQIEAMQNGAFTSHSNKRISLAAFANTPVYGGGMKIAPRARFDDGKLDACVVGDINKFKLFSLFPTVYFGRHLNLTGVEYFQAARFRVTGERPLEVYADGEYVCDTPVEIGVAPAALPVISL